MQPALAWAADRLGAAVTDVVALAGGSTSEMLALTDASGRRSVLRLITVEPWRTHGAELATREGATQRQLAGTGVPAPSSIALDATGASAGHPAHLMSLLPGTVDTDRVSGADLEALAEVLAGIHGVRADPMPRLFQPWAWEAKYVVPPWGSDATLWERAFELLRGPEPAYEPTYLRRDFALRNVLWEGPAVSGVVDWVETSTGPPDPSGGPAAPRADLTGSVPSAYRTRCLSGRRIVSSPHQAREDRDPTDAVAAG